MNELEVETILNLIRLHAGEAPRHPPAKIIPRLAAKLKLRKAVPGRRALGQLIGEDIVSKVVEWLDLKSNRGVSNYKYLDSGTYYCRNTEKGDCQDLRLANFVAEISQVTERIDGSGITDRTFRIESDGDCAEVPAAEFDAMGWVTPAWGPRKSVAPGRETKSHLAEAIKHNNPDVEYKEIYTHSGWIKADGEYLYLHAGGAIGSSGAVEGFTVELERAPSAHSFARTQ